MFKWANLFSVHKTHETVSSPDASIVCHISVESGGVVYTIDKNNKPVVKPSKLGFLFFGEKPLYSNLKIIRTVRKKNREMVELMWGEEREISNNYNEAILYLSEKQSPERIFTLRFRVFNDGVAFRYEIPPQPKFQRLSVEDELTEFNFDLNSAVWKIPAYQPDRYEYNYEKNIAANLQESVHTPLTIRTPNGTYASIHEAALYDYGSMNIKLNSSNILSTDITPLSDNSRAHIDLPFNTPWRVIMLADSAIELTTNRMIYALNPAPSQDFSWVKTLKFLGIWWAMYVGEWTWAPGENHGATTEHALEYINAAARLGISGLLIEGWNDGWEGDWLENGINNQFTVSTPDFDLERVARYARDKNVELVGHHETVGFIDNYEKQLEQAYNYYAANGVHYIKTGYAGSKMLIHGRREYHHSQVGVRHYQKTIELAAKKHICLDIHEPIKGTGIERTWPNLLTREGARGQEYEGGALSPSHVCFLPYTRLLAGGMDYTSGIFDLDNPAKKIHTTIARQLAYFVVIYSGMQMAADRPHFYDKNFPELFKFIKDVPTSFEKTIPLAGEIGEYYIVARKAQDNSDWYLGGVTNEESRSVNLYLNFLSDGEYLAEIYSDDQNANYQTNKFAYKISQQKVTKNSIVKIFLAPGGGFAIRLRKL